MTDPVCDTAPVFSWAMRFPRTPERRNNPEEINFMTYKAILDQVGVVGGYMTDPIGKCLRTTCGKKRTRIDKLYAESATYRAFLDRVPLAGKFDATNAEKAVLRWIQEPKTGTYFPDFAVMVDRKSGIIRQTEASGQMFYGFLSDVTGCVFYK